MTRPIIGDSQIIYCISGLGADHRVFQNLNLGSPYTVQHIRWIDPNPADTLKEYASRLANQINQHKPHVLLGVSFGGVIAQELTLLTKPQKTFVISSIQDEEDIPWYYFLGSIILSWIPSVLLEFPYWPMKFLFGVTGTSWILLKQIIRDSDGKFVKWAIKALVKWKKDTAHSPEICSIHGDKDRLLPIQSPDYLIKNGTHFMIFDKSEEVQQIIEKELKIST